MPGLAKVSAKIVMGALVVWLGVSGLRSQTLVTSTPNERRALAVTVYNSNLALVRDVRQLQLPTGTVEVRFEGLAAQVNPATIHMASLSDPAAFLVLEQSYHNDLLSPATLLEKYVGHHVILVRRRRVNHATQEIKTPALLLADNNGPVWQVGSEILTGVKPDYYIFPRLPKNLYTRPTLLCLVSNRVAAPQTVATTYLTNGMSWKADYVFLLHPKDSMGELSGWAAIRNDSGATYRKARLQLVAGEIHLAAAPRPMMQMQAAPEASTIFQQQPLAEYHLYSLPRPTTLANHASVEISLLHSPRVHYQEILELNGQPYYYRAPLSPGSGLRQPVQVHLRFDNTSANGLGVPMPAGTVRFYQNDSTGMPEFLGEDPISPTPRGETLHLTVGNAFDVVATRKQTAYQSLGPKSSEVAFEITLRNHKSHPVTVEVNEPMGGEWTMLSSNYKYEKTSAFSVRFEVPVPAHGRAALNYRVRLHW